MTRIDLPGGSVALYAYDGLGRRIQKDIDGTVTTYVYDGEDILYEFDGLGATLARYTHGPGIDEPLAMQRDLDASGTFEATETFTYHADGLGSIVQITDSTGTVVRAYAYDSFGRIAAETGTLENPYTYTGREHDEESGLTYYRARYYSAEIGRFITEDPIGFLGLNFNLYRYVNNGPVNWSDPSGLDTVAAGYTITAGNGVYGALAEGGYVISFTDAGITVHSYTTVGFGPAGGAGTGYELSYFTGTIDQLSGGGFQSTGTIWDVTGSAFTSVDGLEIGGSVGQSIGYSYFVGETYTVIGPAIWSRFANPERIRNCPPTGYFGSGADEVIY
jgi:RHS repeat-associated protein